MRQRRLSRIEAYALASGMALLHGCALRFPMEEKREYIDYGIRPGIGLDFVYYDLHIGNKIQTTPAHPADSFLHGETKAGVNSGVQLAPKVELKGSVGKEYLRLTAGGDVRINRWFTDLDTTKKQASDPRPSSSGSFVFTEVNPGLLTYTPSIGLESTLFKQLELGAEIGFPYTGFQVRSGHERFGEREAVQKDDWEGLGLSFGGKIGWRTSEDSSISLFLRWEKYRAEFNGEKATINIFPGNIGLSIRTEF